MIDALDSTPLPVAIPSFENQKSNSFSAVAQKAFDLYSNIYTQVVSTLYIPSKSSLFKPMNVAEDTLISLMLDKNTHRYLRIQLIAHLKQHFPYTPAIKQSLEQIAYEPKEDPCCRLASLHCLPFEATVYPRVRKELKVIAKNPEENPIVRQFALDLWTQKQSKKDTQQKNLLAILQDKHEDPYVRIAAIKMLEKQKIAPQTIAHHLEKLFDENTSAVREASILEWIKLNGKNPQSWQLFQKLIQDPSEDLFFREKLIENWATLYGKNSDTKALFASILQRGQEAIFLRATLLANWGKVEKDANQAIEFLWPWIQSQDELEMKEAALEALKDLDISSEKLLNTLVSLVETPNEDPIIREVAAEALSHIKPYSAQVIQVLSRVFLNEKQDENLRFEAIQGLKNLSNLPVSTSFLYQLKACVNDKEVIEPLRLATIQALGKLGSRDIFIFLCNLAKSKKEQDTVRKAAMHAIAEMKDLSLEKRWFFYKVFFEEKENKTIQQLALSKFLQQNTPPLDFYIEELLREVTF